jgi:hypothetical protein
MYRIVCTGQATYYPTSSIWLMPPSHQQGFGRRAPVCVHGASSEAVQAPTTTPARASPLMPTQVMLSPAQGAQQYASSQVADYEISQQQQPVSVFVELQQKPSACSKSTKQKIAVASGGAIFVLGVIAAVVTLATRSDSPSSQQHTAGVPAPAPCSGVDCGTSTPAPP